MVVVETMVVIETGIDPVEMEQVLSFHIEDQGLGVHDRLAQDPRGEE